MVKAAACFLFDIWELFVLVMAQRLAEFDTFHRTVRS